MMFDWNDYRSQLLQRIGQMGQLSPDTVRGYRALGQAGNQANLLGKNSVS